jgi:hypothetical protein
MSANPAAAAAESASSSSSPGSWPVLLKPALLIHVFKFAFRDHKDVALLHVNSAWEDTAVNYGFLIWERTLRVRGLDKESPPPLLEGTAVSTERHAQQLFLQCLCRVWAHVSYTPAVLSRVSELEIRHLVTALDFSNCRKLTDDGVQHLRHLSELQILNFFGCENLTDACLVHVGKLVGLTHLDIGSCAKMTGTGLAELGKLAALRRLDVPRCGLLTDDSLQHLCHLSELQILNFFGCENLTDACLVHVGKLVGLTHLDIGNRAAITTAAKNQFKEQRPACQVSG